MNASTLRLLLLLSLYFMSACGQSGPGTVENLNLNTNGKINSIPLKSDAEVMALLFDSSYDVPGNFYVDARADTEGSYTIHHVLDDGDAYELCTDDYQTALQWEQADNDSRAVNGYFISVSETERYFEVLRELEYTQDVGNINPTSPGYARVFKCSNTSRDGVDRHELDGYAGQLNMQPVDSDSVRVFAEYLWQFRFFTASRRIVLASETQSLAASIEQTLQLAFLTRRGGEQCDLAEIAEWTFSADRDSGEVSKRFQIVHDFELRSVNGRPELCAG